MYEQLYQVGYGVIAGAGLSIVGFLKSYKPTGEHESFDSFQLIKTVILGAIVGAVSGATGMAVDVVTALPIYAGITAIVEDGLKAIYRRFFK